VTEATKQLLVCDNDPSVLLKHLVEVGDSQKFQDLFAFGERLMALLKGGDGLLQVVGIRCSFVRLPG